MEAKRILIPDFICFASEIGKIVANKCLDRNIPLNTLKLEKFLILIQVENIKKYGKTLFHENIILDSDYKAIMDEVEQDFKTYFINMEMSLKDNRFCEYINLLVN